MTFNPNQVAALADALADGQPVPDETLLDLLAFTDILALGMAADDRRRQLHGSAVTYVRVADLALPPDDVAPSLPPAAREVRVAVPADQLDRAAPGLAAIVRAAGPVPVTACSLADLESTASAQGRALADLCAAVRATGVRAIADAPIDRLTDAEGSWEAARAAGLDVARVTVTRHADPAQRAALLRRVAGLQRASGGVRSFAPLARTWNPALPSTGYEDVRQVALARLLLRDVPSIQVDWSLYGPKLAQVALTFGADDLDGITPSDDAPDGRRRAPLDEVLRNIRSAALTPVERDGAYLRVGE